MTMSLVALLVSFAVSTSFAASSKKSYERAYGVAGCGLGSVVVGKRGGQIFASTTNGTSSNQLFGITFGSLNCTDGPTHEVAMNMDKFIMANRSALSADVAKGDGETLTALNAVIGCNVKSNEMGRLLKSNYNQIFSEGAQANLVTDSIISVIINDSQVATQCNLG